jgi:hypothetical protein
MANTQNLATIMADTHLTVIAPSSLLTIRDASGGHDNVYAAYLSILAYGYKPLEENWSFNLDVGANSRTVTKADYDYVINTLTECYYNYIDSKSKKQLQKPLSAVIKRTPGWKLLTNDGEYQNPVGWSGVGSLASLAAMVKGSPVAGPAKNVPSVCETLLNKIHPEFTNNIERFCNMIRSRSYLALPAMAFGSLQRIVSRLNGILKAFQRAIRAVYQGIIRIIQQFYSYINGILGLINQIMISIIESIIPLDLICLILEAAQILLDDVGFFTSLFSQSGSIFNYLNQFQGYINMASSFVNMAQNPLSTIISLLPPEVKNIMDMVDQIGTDPNSFLSDQLANYGFGYVADALEGNIVDALINKFGKQYKAIPAIAGYLNRLSVDVLDNCHKPAPISPMVNRGSDEQPFVDYHLNPIASSYRTIKRTEKAVEKNLKEAFTGIGDAVNQAGKEAVFLSEAPSRAVKYMFSSAKTQEEVAATGLGGDQSLLSPDCAAADKNASDAADKVASGGVSLSRSSSGETDSNLGKPSANYKGGD